MTRNFEMRRVGLVSALLLFALGVLAGPVESKTVYRAFSPSGAGKTVILKSDSKTYKYFELGMGKFLEFEVTGPTRIKIRSRAMLGEKVSSGEYRIAVWEKEKVRAGRKATTKPSRLSVSDERGTVGVARDVIFDVPKGKHKYSITAQSEDVDKLLVRFHQEKKKKSKPAFETFRPHEFARRVKLMSGKSEISYYLLDDSGGARLKVIGPTVIKIYCRANFDPSMKERSKFTLGVQENGQDVDKFSAVTNKSTKSVFAGLPGMIPSTVHTFTLNVPAGEHVYEFKKINSTPQSLSVRFKILKSSLGKKK